MPLHGKIVVVKRSGGDGTEFPLTATCLFGRKPDCDIRIQLPQVSKEHCRIDLNENKEVILTNLSSVNPTRVNGEALQQSERLKHGDVITIIDRSFRFEYPPAPTPKKRSSVGGKTETFKVLQDQQVGDSVSTETGEKRISEVSTDPHLKDGANHDNIQRSLEKTMELESKEDGSGLQSKTTSPFNDLYQMIKKSLDVKTPRKSSASLLQTPTSRFCTPKPGSVRKNVISTEDKSTPEKNEAKVSHGADEIKGEAENISNGTPKSEKQRKSFQVPSAEMAGPEVAEAESTAKSEATSPQKRNRTTPQRFTVGEVIEQISETPKSPMRRRSKEATPAKPAVTSPKSESLRKPSPRNSGKAEKVKVASKKRKSGELAADLPTPQMKKKRVSFGGYLCPELFDKRLPPDSPLRKGAAPRRSLCLCKPKQSLLRRASVIGLLQDFEQEDPDSPNVRSPAKKRTPSPKKSSAKNASPKTSTPGKKSPKSRSPSPKTASPATKSPKSKTPSPKAASPAKKSPKSRSPSPKAATPGTKSPKSRTTSPKATSSAKQSPKSRTPSPKAATPGKKSPKSKSPSPARGRSPSRNKVETPKANEQPKPGAQTPAIQGRFSVSRISTPSPIAEDADQVPFVAVTPKLPLRRKSISRKTPNMAKSAVKVMHRRSGISRASMKVKGTWANIVKFGPTKAQVAVPAKKTVIAKKTTKKAVSKPQTPARKLEGHVTTGHADSPVTIVVGRAHQQRAVHPTGAAPRLVTNIALLKKNMKMDEDLSGVSEMFKTPVNERKRRSVSSENSVMKTPVGGLGTSVVEPSVLNTPEEPGEMMVSPLSVSSTVKDGRYNSEAVQRLLNGDQDSSFVSDIAAVETHSDDSSEQQCTDLRTTSVTTPKQKAELPECLTGVKRIMKTPRQKAEPVEDLRGRLLKTPKQKPEQQECLTGVKRIMKTPRQKAEPVEDLRGNILKTPKQKPEQQECLTGVKRIFKTPQQEAEPLEDLKGKLLETPKALEAGDASGVKEVVETPAHMQESEDLSEMTDMTTPNVKSSPLVCLTGIKRIMKTPREKSAPVEDMVGVKSLMKTPKQKSGSVEENFEGLEELMEAPLTDPTGQLETNEVEDQTPLDCGVDVAKELDFAHEEPQEDVPSDVIDDVPQVDLEKEADANEVVVDDHLEEVRSGQDNDESSDGTETISQAVVDENLPVEESKVDKVDENVSEEQPKVDTVDEDVSEEQPIVDTVDEDVSEEQPVVDKVDEDVSEEQPVVDTVDENISEEQPKMDTVDENVSEELPKVETATGKVTEIDTTATDPDHEKKSVRGRRAKTVESKSAEDKQEEPEHSEDPVVPAPVRGRRGKKTEATAPPAVRQTTRSRNAKTTDVELEKSATLPSKAALKPKRGRNAKKASDDQAEMVQEVATEAEMVPEPESEQSPPVDVDHEANDSAAPLEKAALKPKRGRKTKPEESVPEQQDVPCTHNDDVPQSDVAKDANEVCIDENKSPDAMETVETATCKVTEVDAAIVEKKSVRGRRAKVVESKPAEDKQEVTELSEDPVVPAPVRGRRGKKTEPAAPPAVRQTTRGRHAKSQESTSDDQPEMVPEKAVEATPVTEISTEAESDQISPENESAPPAEEAVVKPIRGRKTKQAPVEAPQPEPEKNEVVSDDLMADAQPQKSIPALGKPRRGRKTKPDTVEQNDVAEDTVVTVETKQQSQPPVRAKRGRNAKQEEEKVENDDQVTSVEATKSQEPVKKVRRTRKAEQDHVEPREEVQTVEVVVPEEAEAPLVAEPVKMNEQATVTAKPRRGGRKAKQDTESETPVESTEVQEVPAVSSTDKPKRARRGKQVTEEVGVTAEVPEEKPDHEEAEEKNNAEPEAPVIKPSRARGAKSSAKNEVSQAIPAKRARRGAALPLEETSVESTVLVSESTSVEPAKRGRRAAAKPTTDDATVSSDQANPTEDLSSAVVEDAKMSKRSVKWKTDLEEIQKVTPVKAVRARKSKVDTESKNVSKDANKTEEKDLSDKVVEAQPTKRARRGAKVADVTTDEESTSKVQSVEAETQPKTRRGRSAKK